MSETNKPARKRSRKTANVSEFMQQLAHPLKAEVEALRQIILGANPQIREEIKWNAPSYCIEEHFATFNLHAADHVQIIFHRGARRKDDQADLRDLPDPHGLLQWAASDRCSARFHNMREVAAKGAALAEIVNHWIRRM